MRLLRTCGWFLLAAGWLWGLLALSLFPSWPPAVRLVTASVWLLVSGFVVWKMRGVRRAVLLVAGIVLVHVLWSGNTPSNSRAWSPDVEHQPIARFQGDHLTIRNVRHATYRTTTDFDVLWEERHYDLREVRTVDFMVEPFAGWRGLAHTLVTFGFADGEHLAISVETRKERGESYSPLRGMFRHYELIYVVGDERDLIGLRANVRRDPVYLYPIRATSPAVRTLLVAMLTRANRLADQPEFYHSLLNTCTSNIRRHAARLRADGLRPGWRTILPGYADSLAWELGLLDFNGTLDEARQRFQINDHSAFRPEADGRAWSRQIRSYKVPSGG